MGKRKIREVQPFGINLMHFQVYAGGNKERFIRISEDKSDWEVCLDADEAIALHKWLAVALGLPDHVPAIPNQEGVDGS